MHQPAEERPPATLRTGKTHYLPIERSRFLRSLHHAFEGIIYATRTQPNMRVHFIIAALVLLATLVLRLERSYVVATLTLVTLVLSLELVNTAIESLVDLLTVTHHPLAKNAKDAAAGAVLIAAVGAVLAAYLIFYQGVISGGTRVFVAVQSVPANLALIVLAVVAIATIFTKAWAGRGSALQGGAVSGHAALAFAAATMLAFFYQKPLAALLAYFVAFLVAQSRVEARIHRPFEVFWGAILGTLAALAIYMLVRPHVML
ncbi:MAG: diacylglycerol kinase [Candidatus Eremiobacteraeota bacterium]|nr:diacylglycerol kinase [Candidatus Eremiobacteraeota bacterium]MBV9056473.1 diacylglycerol kinase [Candidatus Eremiobacteraeota bacterium]